ncbi:MAG: IclR family transcriptional regulator [Candidatus Nanopelagicales bacterium]|mgnify:FL=1|jgi:DNA-binding IclR family transcriptional regulator|tara:strand:- start:174 stop:950 length:777 start_codon:yes stop_codon:yes gene_type:complete
MDSPRPGAQVLHRATHILRALSTKGNQGLSTTEVSHQTVLTRSTAHRILSALQEEGMVDHDHQSGLWYLGPEMYVLGEVARSRFDITNLARRMLKRLARETGESAFLSARRGDETVCLLREEGSFPLRSFVLHEGVRFPLGVASAGIALLAFESDEFIERYFVRSTLEETYGPSHASGAVRERLRETRARGYSANPGLIVEGSWGMAATVFSATSEPSWALSLTGVESRFSGNRLPALGKLLMDSAHELSGLLQQKAP